MSTVMLFVLSLLLGLLLSTGVRQDGGLELDTVFESEELGPAKLDEDAEFEPQLQLHELERMMSRGVTKPGSGIADVNPQLAAQLDEENQFVQVRNKKIGLPQPAKVAVNPMKVRDDPKFWADDDEVSSEDSEDGSEYSVDIEALFASQRDDIQFQVKINPINVQSRYFLKKAPIKAAVEKVKHFDCGDPCDEHSFKTGTAHLLDLAIKGLKAPQNKQKVCVADCIISQVANAAGMPSSGVLNFCKKAGFPKGQKQNWDYNKPCPEQMGVTWQQASK